MYLSYADDCVQSYLEQQTKHVYLYQLVLEQTMIPFSDPGQSILFSFAYVKGD